MFVLFYHVGKTTLVVKTYSSFYQLTILENQQSRAGHNTEFFGQFRALVHIYLAHLDFRMLRRKGF